MALYSGYSANSNQESDRMYLGYVPITTTDPLYEVIEGYDILSDVVLVNNDLSNLDVEFYIVPSAQSLSDAHKIFLQTVNAGSTWRMSPDKGIVLKAGDRLFAVTSTSSAVTMLLSGAKYSIINH